MSLKVIMKNKKGEILGLKAVDKGSMKGYYDLPGGRIDEDEFATPFEEIIKREIQEEIGSVKFSLNARPVAVGRHNISKEVTGYEKDIHVLYVFFEARYIDGEIILNHEHLGFLWIDISEIKLEGYFNSGILEGIKMYLAKK